MPHIKELHYFDRATSYFSPSYLAENSLYRRLFSNKDYNRAFFLMKKYIYICSAGHSGSTLLDLLLGSHSRIESLGEVTQLPKNIALNTACTCGVPVKSCKLWSTVLLSLGNIMGTDLLANPYCLNLGFINARVVVDRKHQTMAYNLKRKIFNRITYSDLAYGRGWLQKFRNPIDDAIPNIIRLYDTVVKIQNVECIVDSSKNYLKGIKLYLASPRQVKLIFLTRDGRGVFYSNLKRNFHKKQSLLAWRNYYKRTLGLIIKYVPETDFLNVKYEDISTQPEIVLKRICSFVGIEYEATMLDFQDHTHHIANGNNMRLQGSSDIRLDKKWQSALSTADLQLFSRICGSVNKQLGYEQ